MATAIDSQKREREAGECALASAPHLREKLVVMGHFSRLYLPILSPSHIYFPSLFFPCFPLSRVPQHPCGLLPANLKERKVALAEGWAGKCHIFTPQEGGDEVGHVQIGLHDTHTDNHTLSSEQIHLYSAHRSANLLRY